jgi:hypothetical protein
VGRKAFTSGDVQYIPIIKPQYCLFELTYNADLEHFDTDAYWDDLSPHLHALLSPSDLPEPAVKGHEQGTKGGLVMTTEQLIAAFERLLPESRILEDIQKALTLTRQGDVYVIGLDVRFKSFIKPQYSLLKLTYDRDLKILDIDAYKSELKDDRHAHLLPAD